jgi:bifunctional DNA-binding transcriptional regulator/antitoxin component of YhaV-PrlF toxin-antitoxin module
MKLMSKGHVTIPLTLRKRYGLNARTEVTFEAALGGVLIKSAGHDRAQRLKLALRRARGSANSGLGTDEIMRMTRRDD